jgi:hypothetical protein
VSAADDDPDGCITERETAHGYWRRYRHAHGEPYRRDRDRRGGGRRGSPPAREDLCRRVEATALAIDLCLCLRSSGCREGRRSFLITEYTAYQALVVLNPARVKPLEFGPSPTISTAPLLSNTSSDQVRDFSAELRDYIRIARRCGGFQDTVAQRENNGRQLKAHDRRRGAPVSLPD